MDAELFYHMATALGDHHMGTDTERGFTTTWNRDGDLITQAIEALAETRPDLAVKLTRQVPVTHRPK